MHIHTVGDYYDTPGDQPPDLKAQVKDATGQSVRRIGRFIQLALIGAGRCVGKATLPVETAVYFASGRGDMEITIEVMQQLFRDGVPPKPLSFINTVSNAACFYVAQSFSLEGRSSFICNRYFAFESALQLAMLDLESGVVDSALVGVVDAVVPPLSHHRQRLQLDARAPVADASHWLWLGREHNTGPGEILAVRHCADWSALMDWIAEKNLPQAHTQLSAGQFLKPSDGAALRDRWGFGNFEYRTPRAYHDSHSGAVISEFLHAENASQFLLHINGDDDGRYSLMLAGRH